MEVGSIAHPLSKIVTSIQTEVSKSNAKLNDRFSRITQMGSYVQVIEELTDNNFHYIEGMAMMEFSCGKEVTLEGVVLLYERVFLQRRFSMNEHGTQSKDNRNARW